MIKVLQKSGGDAFIEDKVRELTFRTCYFIFIFILFFVLFRKIQIHFVEQYILLQFDSTATPLSITGLTDND